MTKPANPWRGEVSVDIGSASINLHCRMDTLARLLEANDCKTLIEVTRLWDGLSPDVFQKSLRLLADSPAEADEFWPKITGLDGLQILHDRFYQVISGRTPGEMAAEDRERKKLQDFLDQKSAEQISMIVAALM